MRTIGLLGGMSPESTIDYYRRINAGVHRALGGYHGARMLIFSADLDDVFRWLWADDHQALAEHLTRAALALQAGGADFLVMACNTAHLVAREISSALEIPFVHIGDVLGEALTAAGHSRVGLFGSCVTMEAPFYRDHLRERFGIEVVIPPEDERKEIDRIITDELSFGTCLEASKESLVASAEELGARGAEAVVLGCTELRLLLDVESVAGLPVFDTTALHADRAVALALEDEGLAALAEKAA